MGVDKNVIVLGVSQIILIDAMGDIWRERSRLRGYVAGDKWMDCVPESGGCAALGIICERVGNMLRFAKSTLYQWLKREQDKRSNRSDEVLELDGIWAQGAGGTWSWMWRGISAALRW